MKQQVQYINRFIYFTTYSHSCITYDSIRKEKVTAIYMKVAFSKQLYSTIVVILTVSYLSYNKLSKIIITHL